LRRSKAEPSDGATGDREQFLRKRIWRREVCIEKHTPISYRGKLVMILVFVTRKTSRDMLFHIRECARNKFAKLMQAADMAREKIGWVVSISTYM